MPHRSYPIGYTLAPRNTARAFEGQRGDVSERLVCVTQGLGICCEMAVRSGWKTLPDEGSSSCQAASRSAHDAGGKTKITGKEQLRTIAPG